MSRIKQIFTLTLCSVDHASLYNLVNEINLVYAFILRVFCNFIYNLYMCWTSPGPSSGENCIYATLNIRSSVYLTVGMQDPAYKLSAKQNYKYLASHKYSFLLTMDQKRSETCTDYK